MVKGAKISQSGIKRQKIKTLNQSFVHPPSLTVTLLLCLTSINNIHDTRLHSIKGYMTVWGGFPPFI